MFVLNAGNNWDDSRRKESKRSDMISNGVDEYSSNGKKTIFNRLGAKSLKGDKKKWNTEKVFSILIYSFKNSLFLNKSELGIYEKLSYKLIL